jgi:hypothetical protein
LKNSIDIVESRYSYPLIRVSIFNKLIVIIIDVDFLPLHHCDCKVNHMIYKSYQLEIESEGVPFESDKLVNWFSLENFQLV